MNKDESVTLVRVQDLTNLGIQINEMKEMLLQFVDSTKPKTVPINKAAEMLGLHYNTVRKMAIKGILQSQKIFGETGKQMILLNSIEEFLAKKK